MLAEILAGFGWGFFFAYFLLTIIDGKTDTTLAWCFVALTVLAFISIIITEIMDRKMKGY